MSVRTACSRICCLDNMSAEHKLVDQMWRKEIITTFWMDLTSGTKTKVHVKGAVRSILLFFFLIQAVLLIDILFLANLGWGTEVGNIYYSSQVSLGFILVHQCKFLDENVATREETSEPRCTESACFFLKCSVMFLFACAYMLMHLAVCRCVRCCCCRFLCTTVCKQALKRDLIILPRPCNISQESVRNA